MNYWIWEEKLSLISLTLFLVLKTHSYWFIAINEMMQSVEGNREIKTFVISILGLDLFYFFVTSASLCGNICTYNSLILFMYSRILPQTPTFLKTELFSFNILSPKLYFFMLNWYKVVLVAAYSYASSYLLSSNTLSSIIMSSLIPSDWEPRRATLNYYYV